MIEILMWTVLLVFIMLPLGLIARSNMLHTYRMGLINRIGKLVREDAATGKDGTWRYDVFQEADYNAMVFKFWRKFDSFFPDKSFMGLANGSIEDTLKEIEKDMKNKH